MEKIEVNHINPFDPCVSYLQCYLWEVYNDLHLAILKSDLEASLLRSTLKVLFSTASEEFNHDELDAAITLFLPTISEQSTRYDEANQRKLKLLNLLRKEIFLSKY